MMAEPSTPSNLMTFWLIGAAAEPHVVPGAGAGVLRAGRLQHQLRHLAAVDRQVLHFALADVDADARRAEVDARRRWPTTVTVSVTPAACSVRSSANSCAATSCSPVNSSGAKLAERRRDRVDRRLQAGDDVPPLGVGHRPCVPRRSARS